MSKGLKRKFEGTQSSENDGERVPKERKGEPTCEALEASNTLMVQKLSPEDWAVTDVAAEQDDEAGPTVEDVGSHRSTTRGISWKGQEIQAQGDGLSPEVSIMCKRYTSGARSDCETQTYHFLPNVASVASESTAALDPNAREEKVTIDKAHDDDSFISCCVKGCGAKSCDVDASVVFYCLPTSTSERSLWAEILNVDFGDVSENKAQALCSKHFLTSQSSAGHKNLKALKAKTRRKRTCDMLIAEEAEKVKQSLATGRSKRTPKPNRNYDWAELIPIIKSETDSFDDFEPPIPKGPVKHRREAGRGRKQLLDVKREPKERDVHMEDFRTSYKETDDYGDDISSPSILRDRPPKPKGRPNKIRDNCSQTDRDLSSFAKPLREVKVQCNLTAEPLISCSSCSSIDWMRFESLLLDCITLVEGAICNAVLTKCFKKVLDDVTKPSYASNVLKILLGLERDILETGKDIVLVSSQDDDEEVEIENVIHQEQAPLTGLREIIPKAWRKTKVTKEMKAKSEDFVPEEDDSLGLVDATEKDDDEFNPDSYMKEGEEESGDDPNEMDDDDDWDVRKEGDAVPAVKKKKPGPKRKKGHQSLGRKTQDQEAVKDAEAEVPQDLTKIELSKDGPSVIRPNHESETQRPVERKANRKAGDDRWRRGSYKCPKCDKHFTTRLKMDRHHHLYHLGIAPWKGTHLCEECGKTFTQKIGLRVHRMHKHGDPRLFQCTMCDYKGVTKAKLARHILTHYDERIYSCEICGSSLKTQDTYRNHMALHTNSGKYQCDICPKSFHHKQYYEDHRRSHFNIRNYPCEICKTAFKTQKSLRTHIRSVHLNDKRIICGICGARFMTNYNLRSHLKKHERADQAGGKFACNLCSHRFHSEAGLDIHISLAHCDYHQPIQIKVESSKTSELNSVISSIGMSRGTNAVHEESEVSSYTAEVEHVIENIESDFDEKTVHIPDSLADNDSVEPVKIVEAVVEDRGGVPEEHISIVYVFPCNKCGSMFRSQDLLNFHKHSVHLT